MKSEPPWSNKAENAVRRVKELCGFIRKDFEARTGVGVRILEQVGKLLMRHVEYVMNHIQCKCLLNLNGGIRTVTTSERCYGQSPVHTIAPFGAKVSAILREEQASPQEGRYGEGWYLGTLSHGDSIVLFQNNCRYLQERMKSGVYHKMS